MLLLNIFTRIFSVQIHFGTFCILVLGLDSSVLTKKQKAKKVCQSNVVLDSSFVNGIVLNTTNHGLSNLVILKARSHCSDNENDNDNDGKRMQSVG